CLQLTHVLTHTHTHAHAHAHAHTHAHAHAHTHVIYIRAGVPSWSNKGTEGEIISKKEIMSERKRKREIMRERKRKRERDGDRQYLYQYLILVLFDPRTLNANSVLFCIV